MRAIWLLILLVPCFAWGDEFGPIDTGDSPSAIVVNEWYCGSVATSNGSGTLDSVCFLLRHSGDEITQVRCALYLVSDSSFVDSTYHRALDLDATVEVWFRFVNGVSITDATEYVTVCQANGEISSLRTYLADAGPVWRYADLSVTLPWPDPINSTVTIFSNYYHAFKVSYSTGAAPPTGQVIIIQ